MHEHQPEGSRELCFCPNDIAGQPHTIPGTLDVCPKPPPTAITLLPPRDQQARQVCARLRAGKMATASTVLMDDSCRDRRRDAPIIGPLPARGAPITAAHAVRLIADPTWSLQEKLPGLRVLLCKTAAGVAALPAHGGALTLPSLITQSASDIPLDWIMAGALLGDGFLVFDLLVLAGLDVQSLAYRWRLATLHALLRPVRPVLQVVETALETVAKTDLLQRLHDAGREGVVFRKLIPGPTQTSRTATTLEYTFRAGGSPRLQPLPDLSSTLYTGERPSTSLAFQ